MLAGILAVFIAPGTLNGSSKSSLSSLEDKLAAATAQRVSAEKALTNAESSYADAVQKKQVIDQKIYALNLEIDALVALISGYNTQIETKNSEIAAQNEKLDAQYQMVRERIRAKHEDGSIDFLSILFDTDGLRDMFTQVDRFMCMLDYDERLLNTYNLGLDRLEGLRNDLTSEKAELDAKMKALALRREELDSDLKAANKLVASTENRLASAEADLEYIAQVELEYSNKREELLAELARTTNEAYVGGEFLWPLDGAYTRISSGYGWRIHPVTGKQQFHNGIDIPAPYGTEIYAVNAGTVVECSYNYADGYYITVSHGGGVASFYSHLSKYRVKVGDKVTRGQIIANVGTSGYTTGAHLNLNIYENNAPVNPLSYFGG